MDTGQRDASDRADIFPSEIRHRVLEDHARLRLLLERVDSLAHRVLGGDLGSGGELRLAGQRLTEKLSRHLDLEDSILVPALRQIDAWGTERARRVTVEHAAQREQIRGLDRDLAAQGDLGALASELCEFVIELHADMLAEEEAVLNANLLRDDVVGIDVETG